MLISVVLSTSGPGRQGQAGPRSPSSSHPLELPCCSLTLRHLSLDRLPVERQFAKKSWMCNFRYSSSYYVTFNRHFFFCTTLFSSVGIKTHALINTGLPSESKRAQIGKWLVGLNLLTHIRNCNVMFSLAHQSSLEYGPGPKH